MSIKAELIDIARSGRHRLKVRNAAIALAKNTTAHPTGEFNVVVYFSDTEVNLYQLRQWFDVLRAVDEVHRVLIIARSPDAALNLSEDPANPFPVAVAARHNELDPLVAKHSPKVVLYVNHHRGNSAMMWHPDSLHVYIGHGESDKIGISASNQLKAYDFTFVAGQAAIDRIERRLINYDTERRLIEVGRPQVDIEYPQSSPRDGLLTVLYAPSWEGDRAENSYGSVRSHGQALVGALLADKRYRVVFRPHPLSGQRIRAYRKAVEELTATVIAASKRNPERGHVVDTGADFGLSLSQADLCVADVSAVALDAVGAEKPVVVTRPTEKRAIVSQGSVMSRFTLLPVDDAANIGSWLDDAASGDGAEKIAQTREYCFGDSTPGAATRRFVAATSRLANLRDDLISKR